MCVARGTGTSCVRESRKGISCEEGTGWPGQGAAWGPTCASGGDTQQGAPQPSWGHSGSLVVESCLYHKQLHSRTHLRRQIGRRMLALAWPDISGRDVKGAGPRSWQAGGNGRAAGQCCFSSLSPVHPLPSFSFASRLGFQVKRASPSLKGRTCPVVRQAKSEL